jgi:hypothetical protein
MLRKRGTGCWELYRKNMGKKNIGRKNIGRREGERKSKVRDIGDALSSCSEIFQSFFCPFDSAAIPIAR